MTEPAGERDLNHMTFGLSLRARLRRVSFCARGKPLFQNSRFGRHRLPKRHAHGVLTSLTQRATLVVLITRQKKKQPDGLFLFCLVAEMGFEPHDLRVMSPTSYRTAPLRDIMVPETGIEPVRYSRITGF